MKDRFLHKKIIEHLKPKKWFKEPITWITIILSAITIAQSWYISEQATRIQGFDSLLRYTNNSLIELSQTNKALDSNIRLQTEAIAVFKEIYDESKSSNRPFLKLEIQANVENTNLSYDIKITNTGRRNAVDINVKSKVRLNNKTITSKLWQLNVLSPQSEKFEYPRVKFDNSLLGQNVLIIVTVSYHDEKDKTQYIQTYKFQGQLGGSTIFFNNERLPEAV